MLGQDSCCCRNSWEPLKAVKDGTDYPNSERESVVIMEGCGKVNWGRLFKTCLMCPGDMKGMGTRELCFRVLLDF